MKFQKKIKAITKGSFELRNTKNGTMVISREMADYQAIKDQLEKTKIHYYTFHPMSVKPIKAVMKYLPGTAPAEDIVNELLALDYKVISVRQMALTRPQATKNPPLFLVTLPRNEKSQEILKLTSVSHAIIKVEA
jgi:hypothetical protein